MRDIRVAIVPWFVARVLTAVGFALAHVDRFRNVQRPTLDQGLLAWDAAFYADIARHGYDGVGHDGLRFFPLLPFLGRIVGWLPGVDGRAGVLVVALGASLAFGALLHRLVLLETDNAALARTSVWVAALAPNAFVLGMGYAEGVFLLLSTGIFLAARLDRFDIVFVLGLLAGACRPVGVLLAVPIVVIAWRDRLRLTPGDVVARLAAAAAPGVGAVVYLVWAREYTTATSMFTPLSLQNADNLRGGTEFPGPNLVEALRGLVSGDRVGYGLHAFSALVLVALVVVCARNLRVEYTAYATVTLLAALTAHNLESFERYALAAFPFVIAAAIVLRRLRAERVVLALSSAGFVLLCAASLGGRYVP